MTKFPQEMLDDLRRSGLTRADAERLQMEYAEQFTPPGSSGVYRAYTIPYFDLDGTVNGFWRARLLDDYRPKGAKKPQRYTQPPGTAPRLYAPPYVDWPSIARDPSVDVYLTEGEKKAAAMCKLDLPTLGLGGVWNFLSRDADDLPSDPIDDLGLYDWTGRKVPIAFDSDARLKPSVMLAQKALRKQVIQRLGNPYELVLPTLPGQSKTGVDDFIVHHGKKAKQAILELPCRSLFIPEGITADALMKMKFPELRWVVPNLLPPGLAVLAGPPKVGKSWLALQLSYAVASGGDALGARCERGESVYLALEDTERRLRDRLQRLKVEVPPGLHLFTRWPSVEEDGLLALDRWLEAHPDCRLVVIDTLAKMRARRGERSDLYFHDYEAMGALKRIADDRGCALVLVHHLRKQEAHDVFDRISGSIGITGASDVNMVLLKKRHETEGTLDVTGRDIAELELAVKFDEGRWTSLGSAAEHFAAKRCADLIGALRSAGQPLSLSELAARLGKNRSNLHKTLQKLMEDAVVMKQGEKYVLIPRRETNY